MERTRKVRKVSLLHCSSVCLGGLKNRNVGQEQMHLFCFSVTFQVNYYKQNVTIQRENERHRLLGPAALGTIQFPSLWRLWRRGEGLNSEPEFLHYVNNVDCRQGMTMGTGRVTDSRPWCHAAVTTPICCLKGGSAMWKGKEKSFL